MRFILGKFATSLNIIMLKTRMKVKLKRTKLKGAWSCLLMRKNYKLIYNFVIHFHVFFRGNQVLQGCHSNQSNSWGYLRYQSMSMFALVT